MKNKKQRGRKSYRFVDRTRLQLSGGSGGRGCTSMFHIGRKRKKKPDGGHGGNGGSILIIADPVEQSLRWTRPHVTAEAGAAGGSNAKYGRNGKNTIIRVPCGVEKVEIADLDKPGSYVVIAKGGRGGYGNMTFASSNEPMPPPEVIAEYAEPDLGESCRIELELKLIADIGLVGFPNAGKSSLLSATSRATPYIAPYPFTTLNPLVGYIEYRDGFRVCAADVPGLIAGASEGKGKGHDFLRHLERTKALLYIVDAAGIDGRNPISDFEILMHELSAYGDGDMLNRRCLVVANKIDLLLKDEREEIYTRLQEKAEEAGIRMETNVIGISAGATGEGLPLLTKAIRDTVTSSEADKLKEEQYA
ncbi:GTP-binding protein Obg/CgtA [Fragilariopsis cylindrus CCMP1102]|uniref:GTP-binding protein Obg/CgtA n=1 Tax=Fragilariopsis cylindrus CCMP1102 TaxID=635003 RepID=A0A1E7F5A6_9STRA|nr:GTP-binding protein Obg/CgtA [Fragilariopsis cylindrus CCMP1102]|eukprot:OEU13319.1 GTP-binding protein Obg/CgtA [Fragilariopsis cylindrus CCMP1102]